MTHLLVAAAEELTDTVLLPDAPAVDRADRVPEAHFGALAGAGLYGIEAVSDLSQSDRWLITEILASGCMGTAFVWIQHHSAVRALLATDNERLRSAWAEDLLAGRRRAGIAIGGVRPPDPSLRAQPIGSGWSFTGEVPWVTGWGMIDVLLVGAATLDDREVWALIPWDQRQGFVPTRHHLIAAHASSTVHLRFENVSVASHEVVAVERRSPPDPRDGGGRSNGSLALGVVRRATASMGPSPLDHELEVARARLDAADGSGMAAARAAGSELALRAAARLTVHVGSRAVDVEGAAQRLNREAQFTAVFGSRAAIKSELLGLLDRTPRTPATTPIRSTPGTVAHRP
jgi:hypothetical protein